MACDVSPVAMFGVWDGIFGILDASICDASVY